MIHKISGEYFNTKIHYLDVNGDKVTDIPDIANSLAQTSQNSSSQQCTQKFDSYWRQAENNRSSFKSKNLETYNHFFLWMNLHLQYQNLMTRL